MEYVLKSKNIIESGDRYLNRYTADTYRIYGYLLMIDEQYALAEQSLSEAINIYYTLEGMFRYNYAKSLTYRGSIRLKYGNIDLAFSDYKMAFEAFLRILPAHLSAEIINSHMKYILEKHNDAYEIEKYFSWIIENVFTP